MEFILTSQLQNMGFAMKLLTVTVKTVRCYWVLLQFAIYGCPFKQKASHAACKEVRSVCTLGACGEHMYDEKEESVDVGGSHRSIIYN